MALATKQKVPPFQAQHIEAICRFIGDTSDGITGPEIGRFLGDCGIQDTDPGMTKWKRLFNALIHFQNKHHLGNHVVVFMNYVMNPARFVGNPEKFEHWRSELNKILSFAEMAIGTDGKTRRAPRASTLDEAIERANRLKAQLERRNVHPDVIAFCKSEIVAENYFHAVLESMKSISSKARKLSGLDGDGHDLYDRVFCLGKECRPILAISDLSTETLRGEQRGFLNLLKGLYGTVRNPMSHEAKVEWEMSEQDALDIMSAISFVHRKLDKASKFSPVS